MTQRAGAGRGSIPKVAMRALGSLLSIAATALLAEPVATAQSQIRDVTDGAPLQIVTQTLRGGVAPAGDDTISQAQSYVDDAAVLGTAVPASAGLTIIPIFDATITSDPNAAQIEATINTAIADFQSKFADPITVTITLS